MPDLSFGPEERDDEDLRFDYIFEGSLLDLCGRDQSGSSHRGESQQCGWNREQHDGFPGQPKKSLGGKLGTAIAEEYDASTVGDLL